MKSNNFYSFVIDVLTNIKLYEAYKSLGEESDYLNKIKDESLALLKNYSNVNEENPHLNIAFKVKIKLIDKDDGLIIFKDKNDEFNLLTFDPILGKGLEEGIKEKINDLLKAKSREIKLKAIISKETLLINGKIRGSNEKPTYYAYYEVKLLDEIDAINLKKVNAFIKKESKLNEADEYILKNY